MSGGSIATYTTAEYVININNIWSKCWNINLGLPIKSPAGRINLNDKSLGLAFRAILKEKFLLYGGFNPKVGYIDDRTVDKIRNKVQAVDDAICYHYNPDTLIEVFQSARWIGRSKMFTFNIKNLVRYSFINSFRVALNKIINGSPIYFLIFKIVFDFGLLIGIINNNQITNRSK